MVDCGRTVEASVEGSVCKLTEKVGGTSRISETARLRNANSDAHRSTQQLMQELPRGAAENK
jgi:hypothetical protein